MKTRSFFLDWAQENGLVQTENLSGLQTVDPARRKEIAVGVDGGHLLNLLQTEVAQFEPNYFLSNPIPHSAAGFLDQFLKGFADARIKPVIVFDGMDIESEAPLPPRSLSIPWDKVQSLSSGCTVPPVRGGRNTPPPSQSTSPVPPLDPFQTLNPAEHDALRRRVDVCSLRNDEDVTGWVIRYLIEKKVDVFRAPYWAWPQLAAFLHKSNRYVGEVFGPPEMLAFSNVDRLIIEIDFSHPAQYKYISKKDCQDVLHKMMPHLDLGLCIMFDSIHRHFSTFVFPQNRQVESFGHLAKMISTYAMEDYIAQSPRYRMVQSAVKHPLVLTVQGEVTPLSKIGLPPTQQLADEPRYREIFGTRLPPCFYFFLFTNVISPQTLIAVVNGRISDPPMLVETKEGKIAVERVLPLRTQIVFQIVQQLAQTDQFNNYFQQEFALTWMRNNMPVPILRPPQIKLDEWSSIRSDEVPTFGTVLEYAVNATRDASYRNVKQALAAVHLKSLDLLGYFTHATHSNSSEVSGKSVYSDALAYAAGDGADQAVLLIELLRTRSLTDSAFSTVADSRAPLPDGYRFFIRLVSLVPVELKRPFTGPTHVGLLAFNATVRHLHRTLRGLTEVVSLTLFLENRTEFGIGEYAKFPSDLPFRAPPGIIGGIIGHFLLNGPADEGTHRDWEALTSSARRYEYLGTVFPDVHDIKQAVSDIFYFWDVGVLMLIQLGLDETPTVDPNSISLATRLHDEVIVPLAAKFDIALQRRGGQGYN